MILTGEEIVYRVGTGQIVIDPFDEKIAGPNSYDLRLAERLLVYEDLILDTRKPNRTREILIPPEGYLLHPGIGYLGGTIEACGSAEYVCEVDGRSSVGRLFLSVHCTAGRGDLGFEDCWCLEMFCTTQLPVRVYAGDRLCQATFFATVGDRKRQYKGRKYSGQKGATPSLMWKDHSERKETT